MEAAEYRSRYNPPEPLDWSMDRSVLAQRQMSAGLIVVGHIRLQDLPHVGFPEDDHMVEAFPSDRPDQPLNVLFYQGDRGAVGRSRMSTARRRRTTALP